MDIHDGYNISYVVTALYIITNYMYGLLYSNYVLSFTCSTILAVSKGVHPTVALTDAWQSLNQHGLVQGWWRHRLLLHHDVFFCMYEYHYMMLYLQQKYQIKNNNNYCHHSHYNIIVMQPTIVQQYMYIPMLYYSITMPCRFHPQQTILLQN